MSAESRRLVPPPSRRLAAASRAAAVWALFYALYRAYYALGGTWAMLGTPRSHADWIRINAVAAVLLFAAAILPVVAVGSWRSARMRPLLSALAWVVTVACVSHALVSIASRALSLTGVLTIDYPFWATIDTRKADLQDLFFNEPWFLIEGLLWAAMAWFGAQGPSQRRAWWVGTAIAACTLATAVGMLTTFEVLPRVIVG